ncbi:MAG: 50S ribosomal protein L2 [Candidatus Veblenbacteria bacterium]|nr:50S ribosomal protein L2 [Candidatus Veblenbacteria bacterium]MDZ4230093.1 50S ribosomal protein L2 [Candidatus Veblenbacteria bacterium]
MPVKLYQPITPGRRHAGVLQAELTNKRPEKRLVRGAGKSGGRNAQGKITVRHRGGGAKRLLRLVDFKRDKFDVAARVAALEYDPSRTANLALLHYHDGDKRYVIAPEGLQVGEQVMSSQKSIEVKVGNRLPLKFVPPGMQVHDVELSPGRGGVMVRSAGSWATLMSLEVGQARLKLPSGETRSVSEMCLATVGQVGNVDHSNVRLGKAGRMRHLGFRPTVRGKAMNPVDHPHGGGEGHNPIGMKHPKTPWGKPALGVRTRRAHKASNRFIISRRRKQR